MVNNNDFISTLDNFFNDSIQQNNDLNIEEDKKDIIYYKEQIDSLINKINIIYNIEVNALYSLLSEQGPSKQLFSLSYLTMSQKNIEIDYQEYKNSKDSNSQQELPENYQTLKLDLYKSTYSVIMNFRTYLLGENENIQYRIATKFDLEQNIVEEITIDKEEYLKTFTLGRASLPKSIANKTIEEILNILEENKSNNNLQTAILSNTAKLKYSSLLELQNKQNLNKKKNKKDNVIPNLYNVYQEQYQKQNKYRNTGSLYEIYTKIKGDKNNKKLEDYLKHSSGNVPFYKGGDDRNLQIKLFNASVATLKTMKRALESIQKILNTNIKNINNSGEKKKQAAVKQLTKDLLKFYTIKMPNPNSAIYKHAVDIVQTEFNKI